jgi:hypothetical protein
MTQDATVGLKITWRDEAYGNWAGARAAFRLYDTIDLSDASVDAIHTAAQDCGFTWDATRCSWIAWDLHAAGSFSSALAALGHPPIHAGRWPDGPPATAP